MITETFSIENISFNLIDTFPTDLLILGALWAPKNRTFLTNTFGIHNIVGWTSTFSSNYLCYFIFTLNTHLWIIGITGGTSRNKTKIAITFWIWFLLIRVKASAFSINIFSPQIINAFLTIIVFLAVGTTNDVEGTILRQEKWRL